MNARTKSLFHFTKSLNTLKLILNEGFWPQYCLEDIKWLDNGPPFLAWPMVSFCDIPISRLGEHTEFYGYYGVGLYRERWMANGVNPIFYVSPNSIVKQSLAEMLAKERKNPDLRSKTNAIVVLAHCKPLKGLQRTNGEMREKDFYGECEWRYIQWVDAFDRENKYGFSLTEAQFNDPKVREEANNERRKHLLGPIVPADITHLLVKSVEDAYELVRFIDEEYWRSEDAHCPDDILFVLKSRILVLDDVLHDN
jgi:hypothetical protein